jgi:hypothetical protein
MELSAVWSFFLAGRADHGRGDEAEQSLLAQRRSVACTAFDPLAFIKIFRGGRLRESAA